MSNLSRETIKRFLEEIGSVSKKTLNKPRLYGWGSNNFGQLGVNTGNLTINTPVDISLPVFDKDDQIVHLECGWKASAFITMKGNVWLTEPIQKKIAAEEEDKQSKKKKKDGSEVSGSKEGEKGACKWVDITPIFQRLK